MIKFIYKFFLLCSAFVSVLSIGIISVCIIVMSNKSITIKDENKYISSLISWYFNNEVSFDEIQIYNKSMNKTYEINIKNIFVDKFNGYKNLKVKNLSLNMKPINLFSEFQKFNLLIVDNLSVDYIDDHEFDNNLSIEFTDSILNISDIIKINTSKINIYIEEKLYNLTNINIRKMGTNEISINGAFNYKDNYLQKNSKEITFLSSRHDDRDIINLKFKDIHLDESIVKKLINISNLNLNTSISGEMNLNFINSLLSTIDINILSQDVKVSFNNDFKYNGLSLNNHPEIKFINFIGTYKFKEEEFIIKKLNINIPSSNNIESKIFLKNNYSLSDKNNYLKIFFENIDLHNFLYLEGLNDDYNIFSNITGSSDIFINKNNINSINISINSFSYKEINLDNINYEYKKDLGLNDIKFSLSTKYKIIEGLLNNNEIINISDKLPFKSEDKVNLSASLNLSNIKENIFGSINGSLILEKHINLLSNNLIINSVDYVINFDKKTYAILADFKTNTSAIKFKFIKNKNGLPKINFNFPISAQLLSKAKFIKGFNGKALLECSLIDMKFINYNCNVNLKDTYFTIPFLKYVKPKNDQAILNFSGLFSDTTQLNDVKFIYENLDNIIEGKLNFIQSSNAYTIDFSKFIYDRNNLKSGLIYDDDIFKLNIYSGNLDLNLFIENNFNSNTNLDILVNANLDKLFVKDSTIDNASIKYENLNNKKALSINGQYYSDESIIFNYNNLNTEDILSYNFKASNAGKFFELFDYKSEIKDGVLSSEGFIGALDNDNDIMGTISIDDFKVMKAPLFAELLLAASLTGLFDLLNNEGIEFEQFDAQFTGKDNTFLVSKSRAYGFSLGVTAEGEINNNEKNIKLVGSIIPAYKINSLLNNVPLVGDLLTAKEDEGIFAINYDANGPWDEPKIQVNPLSLLTPGIIRNIFN